MRDANRIAQAEMFSASVDTTISINLEQLGEAPDAAMRRVLYAPRDATEADLFVADRVYDALFRALVRVQVFADLDVYGSAAITPEGFVSTHFEMFACPYGRAWLEQKLAEFPDMQGLAGMLALAETGSAASALAARRTRTDAILAGLQKATTATH